MKTKFLSTEYIELNDRTRYNHFFDCSSIIAENHWEDCPIKSLYSPADSTHFRIDLKNDLRIFSKNTSLCVAYKIVNGYFKNAYLIVEFDRKSRETCVYIASNNKLLNYVSVNKILTIDEVEQLLSNEKISQRLADVLKEFNITKYRQTCESFCENLPTECLLNREFIRDVIKRFSQTPINIVGAPNTKFIKFNECIDNNLKVFKSCIVNARNNSVELCL